MAGRLEYVNRGGGWQPTSFIGESGKTIWTHPAAFGVNDMAPGDLDADGLADFVVGYNGGGGIAGLSNLGKETWRKDGGNIWHVEVADIDGDGKWRVVHTDASGARFFIRDTQGEPVREVRSPAYASNFALCRWPPTSKVLSAITVGDGTIWLSPLNHDPATSLKAPESQNLGEVRAVALELDKVGPVLAILARYRLYDRALLYLFDSKGSAVYAEVLESGGMGLLAHGTHKQALLVGGTNIIWIVGK